ncbi:calmodulin-beta-like isoform X1 [Symsagittifera roscoffensis]|uniref:calmodulin-beta-like isoform X1 n=1 Tax=Symsagittifera roscoffensis TaxID=84072 RepID=UPI00307BB0C1
MGEQDEGLKIRLMDQHAIPEEEQQRVLHMLKQHNISDDHFKFYLSSFKFFDRDPEDNTIKNDELVDALRCFGLNPSGQDVQQLLIEFDTNSKPESSSSVSAGSHSTHHKNSNLIELSEYILMAKAMLSKHDPEALQNAFKFFDVNGDGFISTDELKKALTECGDTMTDEEVDEMMSELDIDHDNRINVHEFVVLLKSHDQL